VSHFFCGVRIYKKRNKRKEREREKEREEEKTDAIGIIVSIKQ
jgi:hypothetical protein